MRLAPAAALALLLLSTASCGGSTDPGPCIGTFDGSVSGSGGAPNTTFSGCGFHTGGSSFILTLGVNGDAGIGLGASGGRPATGTHTIGAWGTTDPLTGTFTLAEGGNVRFFRSQTGTLTVTESSPGTLKGTITMTVRETVNAGSPEVTATVTATFDAPCSAQRTTC